MKEVTIRDFSEKDMEKTLDCREESGKINFPGLPLDREKERAVISDHVKKHPGALKVAEIDGKPVGYVRCEIKKSSFGDCGLINAIFVDKNHRKAGIGKLLMEAAEKWLASKGIDLAEATVTNTNAPSLSFFKSQGYEEERTVLNKRLKK